MGSAVYSKIALLMFTHQNLWIHIANFGALAYKANFLDSRGWQQFKGVWSMFYACTEGIIAKKCIFN